MDSMGLNALVYVRTHRKEIERAGSLATARVLKLTGLDRLSCEGTAFTSLETACYDHSSHRRDRVGVVDFGGYGLRGSVDQHAQLRRPARVEPARGVQIE